MGHYIVFDLEWNQSPEGKEGADEQIPFEILEIGALRLDETFCIVSEFHKLIKPRIYQKLHFKISEVTHLDMEELLNQGEEFPEAIREFLIWCGEDYRFCTWGPMDLTELQMNMAYYQMPIPFEIPLFYYDIQKLYSLLQGKYKARLSLDVAVEEMGIREDRPFHRASDDAYYTAKLMKTMDFLQVKEYLSIDYFRVPQNKEDEIWIDFPDYSKYVSRAFDTKEDAIADKSVTDMICYRCRRMLRKKIQWFSSNQKYYYALARCPEHGFLKGKIRLKKADNGKVFAVKTLKLVGEEGAGQIYIKREDLRKRRNEKSRMRKKNRKQSEE